MLEVKTKTHKYLVEWLPESQDWTGSQLSLAYGKDAEKSIKRIITDTEKKEPFWNLCGAGTATRPAPRIGLGKGPASP